MTDADLAQVRPGLCFVCADRELLMRSLSRGPDLRDAPADLIRAAWVYMIVLAAWRSPDP